MANLPLLLPCKRSLWNGCSLTIILTHPLVTINSYNNFHNFRNVIKEIYLKTRTKDMKKREFWLCFAKIMIYWPKKRSDFGNIFKSWAFISYFQKMRKCFLKDFKKSILHCSLLPWICLKSELLMTYDLSLSSLIPIFILAWFSFIIFYWKPVRYTKLMTPCDRRSKCPILTKLPETIGLICLIQRTKAYFIHCIFPKLIPLVALRW